MTLPVDAGPVCGVRRPDSQLSQRRRLAPRCRQPPLRRGPRETHGAGRRIRLRQERNRARRSCDSFRRTIVVSKARSGLAPTPCSPCRKSACAASAAHRVSMIFQEPMTSLNPVMTIGRQIAEALYFHRHLDRTAAAAEAVRLFERVQVPAARQRFHQYPHSFSGRHAPARDDCDSARLQTKTVDR